MKRFTIIAACVILIALTAFVHPPICSTDLFRLDTMGRPWQIVGILYHPGGAATINLYRNEVLCSLRTRDAATIEAFEREIMRR